MKQITINPNNEPYYSEDFIKGFKCGAQRQFEADKDNADRQQGEWKPKNHHTDYCSNCGFEETQWRTADYNYCPNCGADMREPKLQYGDTDTLQGGLMSAT